MVEIMLNKVFFSPSSEETANKTNKIHKLENYQRVESTTKRIRIGKFNRE